MQCIPLHQGYCQPGQTNSIFLGNWGVQINKGFEFFIRITTVGDIMHMYVIWSEVYVQAGVTGEYTLVDVIRVHSQAHPCT